MTNLWVNFRSDRRVLISSFGKFWIFSKEQINNYDSTNLSPNQSQIILQMFCNIVARLRQNLNDENFLWTKQRVQSSIFSRIFWKKNIFCIFSQSNCHFPEKSLIFYFLQNLEYSSGKKYLQNSTEKGGKVHSGFQRLSRIFSQTQNLAENSPFSFNDS